MAVVIYKGFTKSAASQGYGKKLNMMQFDPRNRMGYLKTSFKSLNDFIYSPANK